MDFGGETSFEERDLNIIIFFDKTNDKNLKKRKLVSCVSFPLPELHCSTFLPSSSQYDWDF